MAPRESPSGDGDAVLLYSLSKRKKWAYPISEGRGRYGESHHIFPDLVLDDERLGSSFRQIRD